MEQAHRSEFDIESKFFVVIILFIRFQSGTQRPFNKESLWIYRESMLSYERSGLASCVLYHWQPCLDARTNDKQCELSSQALRFDRYIPKAEYGDISEKRSKHKRPIARQSVKSIYLRAHQKVWISNAGHSPRGQRTRCQPTPIHSDINYT